MMFVPSSRRFVVSKLQCLSLFQKTLPFRLVCFNIPNSGVSAHASSREMCRFWTFDRHFQALQRLRVFDLLVLQLSSFCLVFHLFHCNSFESPLLLFDFFTEILCISFCSFSCSAYFSSSQAESQLWFHTDLSSHEDIHLSFYLLIYNSFELEILILTFSCHYLPFSYFPSSRTNGKRLASEPSRGTLPALCILSVRLPCHHHRWVSNDQTVCSRIFCCVLSWMWQNSIWFSH